ncbi:FG-GAP repeat domain-containing protein [Engelhardtia mirabilis]|uniref:FG-GAP repeat protein n=1 Tax=Engelhardtia mirabilis TaxID=2528011 RepID=A0A518BN28_9BACT|nr:FG-GAP repeat protein [Planctomycetes bacterium Pla133]QDV02669.1 FG-GAP repeat protein [Planctomycetes bacterium Pla86]
MNRFDLPPSLDRMFVDARRSTWFARALGLAVACSATAAAQTYAELHGAAPGDAPNTLCGVMADLDGDQRPDVLLGLSNFLTGPMLARYGNDGAGALLATVPGLDIFSDFCPSIGAGDWNGDGHTDLIVAADGHAGGRDKLFVGDGTGNFVQAQFFVTDSTVFVDLVDVAGDSRADLLRTNGGNLNISFAGGGGAVVTTPTSLARVGDLDGNGSMDLFGSGVVPFVGSQAWVAREDGLGGYPVDPAALPVGTVGANDLQLLDADGDGDLDAWLVREGADQLLSNGGAGVFTEATGALPADADLGQALAIGDVDGDGDPDGVVGNGPGATDGADRLLLNGGGVFTEAVGALVGYGERTTFIELVDLDADGDLDLLRGGHGAPLRPAFNDGAGTFADASAGWRAAPRSPRAIATIDVDGDLDLDVILARAEGTVLVPNGGGGDLEPEVVLTSAGALDIATGDVDGDGDLDLLLCRGAADPVLLLSVGGGAFAPAPVPAVGTALRAGVLTDIDGDGDLDAVLVGDGGRLWLGDGSGTFVDASGALPTLPAGLHDVVAGDLDGDGDPDLLAAAAGDGSGAPNLLIGNLGGLLVDVSALLPGQADASYSLALADLNGDGALDVVVGNGAGAVGAQDRLWINTGFGLLVDSPGLGAALNVTEGIGVGDVDLDGDVDLLLPGLPATSPFGDPTSPLLHLNDGLGTFTAAPLAGLSPSGPQTDLALADLDGDGAPDLLLASDVRLQVALERTHQLAWRALPRVGKDLVLDLWSPDHTTWQVALATARTDLPLPPFGTLLIDLTTLVGIESGAFDPNGTASDPIAVPAVPALVGAVVELQALFGPALQLSNRETVVLSGY